MEADHECQSHPIRFVLKFSNTALDFLVGDFAFFSGRDFCDPQFSNGIGADHASLHGRTNDLAKKLGAPMAVLRTENPVGFLHSAKVTRHGFEIVAIEVIDLEGLARNAKSRPRKILVNEVRRKTEAGGSIAEISLFKGERFGELKGGVV